MTKSLKMKNKVTFAFFGTSHIATVVLDELEKAGLMPALVVTMPPKKKGRGLAEVRSDVEMWADSRGIPHSHEWDEFKSGTWDVAIVVDYGKILPSELLAIPRMGFLNMHPSLLPRLRGASPMRSAILNDERETGVSIIRIDEEMDHGPIVAQRKVSVSAWPVRNSGLERLLVPLGGALLAQILPEYVRGNIEAREQNHDVATYCEKFSKEDGFLDLNEDAYKNLLKVRAFEGWPGTFAFFERNGQRIRTRVIDAKIENGKFVPTIVKPEGKRDMPYDDFLRSGARPV